jgi:hypothetical protein
MVHVTWSEPSLTTPAVPAKPKRKRSTEPQPFAGLTHKPHGVLCDQETGETAPAPPRRPDPRPPTHRRTRTVDTSMHFCLRTACAYHGWLGLKNLRANSHPNGGPWDNFPVPRATALFPSTMIPSFMRAWRCWKIIGKLRENGLHHARTTQTRRSPAMRVQPAMEVEERPDAASSPGSPCFHQFMTST